MSCQDSAQLAIEQTVIGGGIPVPLPCHPFITIPDKTIIQWVESAFRESLSTLSIDDCELLADYSGDFSFELNGHLRENGGNTLQYFDEIMQLDRIISKNSIPVPIRVFRGCFTKAIHNLESAKVGDIVTDFGYTSTSLKPYVGKMFVSTYREQSDGNSYDVQFFTQGWEVSSLIIDVPAGSNGVFADFLKMESGKINFDMGTGEAEIILPRNSRYIVKDIFEETFEDRPVKTFHLELLQE